MWSCSPSLIFMFHTGTDKSEVPFPPYAPAITQKFATFMQGIVPEKGRQHSRELPPLAPSSGSSVPHSLLSPMNEQSCAGWSSSRLRVPADSPRTRPAHGHSRAGQHGLGAGLRVLLELQTHTVVPGWHTGLAQTLEAKPCPKPRAQRAGESLTLSRSSMSSGAVM